MKTFITALILSTTFAHASYYVKCGNQFSESDVDFKEVVFEASSENEVFSGKNGKAWEVALKGKWLPQGTAVASVVKGNLEIKVSNNKKGIQEIGTRFVVEDMYSDNPTLKVYNVGGFAGGTQIGKHECMTSVL